VAIHIIRNRELSGALLGSPFLRDGPKGGPSDNPFRTGRPTTVDRGTCNQQHLRGVFVPARGRIRQEMPIEKEGVIVTVREHMCFMRLRQWPYAWGWTRAYVFYASAPVTMLLLATKWYIDLAQGAPAEGTDRKVALHIIRNREELSGALLGSPFLRDGPKGAPSHNPK
jgi:hypothetical protein